MFASRCGVRSGSLVAAWFLPGLLSGCGAPAAPQPPTLNLPAPVRDLSAVRIGDEVHLDFTIPAKTTDKLPVRGDMTAQLCRAVEAGPCQPVGTSAVSAALSTSTSAKMTASLDDTLPADLTQGAPRLLTYRVTVLNHAAKAAAASAPAFARAGAAPAAVAGFQATPRRNGVLLSWRSAAVPTGEAVSVRFARTRTAGPSAPVQQAGLGGGRSQEEPAEQGLRVSESAAERRPIALDRTARTGRSYRYTAQRVQQMQLGKHTLEVASLPSAPVNVVYSDVFPPPTPTGLVSAADTPGGAIDLSWTPDEDPGLAGYVVYRRLAGSGNEGVAPARISPAGKPVTTPAWRDTTVIAGQRYKYSVSAVDTSGNESKRSAEVEDGLAASTARP